MRRLLLLFVVALLAVSCGDDSSDTADTGTGTDETVDDATADEAGGEGADPELEPLDTEPAPPIDDDGQPALSVDGDEVAHAFVIDNLVTWEAFRGLPADTAESRADLLTFLVQVRALEAAAEAQGAEADDEVTASAAEQLDAFLGDVALQAPDVEFTDELLDELERLFVAQEALTAANLAEPDLSDEAFEAFTDQSICTSHVLVETEAEATEVLERLEGGEALADVAADVSIDPSAATNGGDLGCVGPGSFVPEYEEAALAAEPGETVGPVESEFGFHVIRTASTEELRDDFEVAAGDLAVAEAANAAQVAVLDVLESLTIEVNDQYGSWSDEEFRVVPG